MVLHPKPVIITLGKNIQTLVLSPHRVLPSPNPGVTSSDWMNFMSSYNLCCLLASFTVCRGMCI